MRRRVEWFSIVTASAVLACTGEAFAQGAPWSSSESPSAPPPPPRESGYVSSIGAVQPFDVHSYLTPRPGTVAIELRGDAHEVAVSVPSPSFGPMLAATSYAYLCTTPCTLFLAPGGASLHLGLPNQLQQDVSFVVNPDEPRRIVVGQPAIGRVLGMIVGYGFGTFFLLGGVAALAIGASGGTVDPVLLGIGIGASAIGSGLLALAIGLTATMRSGIVSNAPLEQRTRSARVRFEGVGLGLVDSGTGAVAGMVWRF